MNINAALIIRKVDKKYYPLLLALIIFPIAILLPKFTWSNHVASLTSGKSDSFFVFNNENIEPDLNYPEETYEEASSKFHKNFYNAIINRQVGRAVYGQLPEHIISKTKDSLNNSGTPLAPVIIEYILKPLGGIFSAIKRSDSPSAMHLFLFIMMLVTILYYLIPTKLQYEKKRFLIYNGLLILGFMAFVVGLFLIYFYRFGPQSQVAHNIGSFGRYISTFICAWMVIVYAASINISKNNHSTLMYAAILIAPIFLFYSSSIDSYRFIYEKPRTMVDLRNKTEHIASAIRRTVPLNAKIYLIWQNVSNYPILMLRYALLPRRKPSITGFWSFGNKYFKSDYWTKSVEHEKFLQLINGYQYVVIVKGDEYFWNNYGKYIPQKSEVDLPGKTSDPYLSDVRFFRID